MQRDAKRKTKAVLCLTIDREEERLNQMCAQGWKPVKIILGIWFVFEKCQPGEYIVRVTTGIDPKGSKASRERRERVVEFLTDLGAEIIPEYNVDADSRIYAVRPASLGEFEINTDIDALIADYTARRRYHIGWSVVTLLLFAAMVSDGILNTYPYHFEQGQFVDPAGFGFELASAAVMAFLLICAFLPVPAYTRKIRELRERRQIEE